MSWPEPTEYFVKEKGKDHLVVCYNNTVIRTGLWQAENALVSTLPIFILQLVLILFLSRLLMYILKPLHQPRVVSEILAGVLLGPSVLGSEKVIGKVIFPFKSILPLECVANYGLVYFMFLVGLELDLNPIKRAGSKAISIALAGLILPIPVGIGLYHLVFREDQKLRPGDPAKYGPLFWGIGLAATNFPDLARILADIKLLHSEMGRTALSAAVISDLCSWILLVITMAVSNEGDLYDIFFTACFVLISLVVLRPAVNWIMRRTAKDDRYNNGHVCYVLMGVLLCGAVTDACGSHSILGGFMWGVILPRGELKETILEKVETFVSDVLMPAFFLVIGLRMNLQSIVTQGNIPMIIFMVFLAASAKILSTFLISLLANMPPREGLSLGLLMNTKGLLALIILSSGRDVKALGNLTYSVMLMAFWIMTVVVGPLIAWLYKSIRRSSSRQYKRRTIQSIKPGTEFRIVACIHSTRNVSGLVNLLWASNPTKQSPICVFAMHLVELVGRASAMLIVHGQCNSSSTRSKNQNDQIMGAFENLESEVDGVSVHSLTAVSPYTTMHDDICDLAEEKRASLILVPFHKQFTIDGALEDGNPSVGAINKHVLDASPCSVGLLVDRGLGSSTLTDSNHSGRRSQQVAMFFIGGPDDREALAYVWRMSVHPAITVTVVRFLEGEEAKDLSDMDLPGNDEKGILNAIADIEKENLVDNEFIEEFKLELQNNHSIDYHEIVVNNGEETLKAVSQMESDFDLYVVGRGRGMVSPLMSGLSELSDFPELGPLGDTLVSSSFAADVSVLIVQCADESNDKRQEEAGHLSEQFGHMTWQPPAKKNNGDFEPFVHQRDANGGGEIYY